MPPTDAPVPGPAESSADASGAPDSELPDTLRADVEVTDPDVLLALTGPGATRLSIFERRIGLQAGTRGDVIHLQGPYEAVCLAQRVIAELMEVVRDGARLKDGDVEAAIRLLRDHPEARLSDIFQQVVVTAVGGRQITPRGLAQRFYVQEIQAHDIVFGVGPAGTGKTYLAMAMAVAALTSQRVKRIILTRPAVEAGEKLGFLPGDMTEKVDPYLRPLYDALHDMLPAQRVYNLIERGTIEVAPLAFMRGRTLNDAFVILDEAQNTTVPQMRMFLTRIGQRSKAVITGDMTQVDLAGGRDSGLSDAVRLLEPIEGLSVCRFSSFDVVRHALVQRIVEAYDRRDALTSGDGDDGQER
jgi:phosphate starvation-inducible PhoH-like protein